MQEAGSWFLLAKCLKNTCRRVTFYVKMLVDDRYLYLQCHSSTGVFQTFATKNQLPGLSTSRTLVENELKTSEEA